MIKLDEFTFSLPRLWAAILILCLADLIIALAFFTGTSPIHNWLPRIFTGVLFLYGPDVIAVGTFGTIILGVIFHWPRGLWLLVPFLFVVPVTYLHWALTWNCILYGNCL